MRSYQGIVRRGDGRGKELGYPTANIPLADDSVSGIYAAIAHIKGSNYHAAVFIDTHRKLLEAHILHFEDDLYGLEMTVTLKQKIRESASFAHDAALKAAIDDDIEKVKAYFA